jgi:hypothetical protein
MSKVHFSKAPKRPTHVPPGGEPIVAAGKALGYAVGFKHYYVGDEERFAAYAYRPGASCLRQNIGTVHDLVALSPEALQRAIAAKFAAKDETTIPGWGNE